MKNEHTEVFEGKNLCVHWNKNQMTKISNVIKFDNIVKKNEL